MSLSYTNEQVDEMTLPMLDELNKYWKDNPPLHILVKNLSIYFGTFKPETKQDDYGDLGELMAMTNAINGIQQ